MSQRSSWKGRKRGCCRDRLKDVSCPPACPPHRSPWLTSPISPHVIRNQGNREPHPGVPTGNGLTSDQRLNGLTSARWLPSDSGMCFHLFPCPLVRLPICTLSLQADSSFGFHEPNAVEWHCCCLWGPPLAREFIGRPSCAGLTPPLPAQWCRKLDLSALMNPSGKLHADLILN